MFQLISVFINGISSSKELAVSWKDIHHIGQTHHKITPSTFGYHFSSVQNILFGILAVHYRFPTVQCMMSWTGDWKYTHTNCNLCNTYSMPHDKLERVNSVTFILEELTADDNYLQKILFSDKAIFHTHGVVNCHNCRIWGSENPHALMKHVRDSQVNVWCSIMSDRIVGSCFFHKSTIMSAVYLDMLENFVFPQIVADVDSLIFQQDGAPVHFGAIVSTALDKQFPGLYIGMGGPINSPPWSPDWNPRTSSSGDTSKTSYTANSLFLIFHSHYCCCASECATSGVGWNGTLFPCPQGHHWCSHWTELN